MDILQINSSIFDNPYNGCKFRECRNDRLLSRLLDKKNPVNPLCYPDLTCHTKNFSMCRFPNTKWNARLYYDNPRIKDQFRNCNYNTATCPAARARPCPFGNQCDKYLFKV